MATRRTYSFELKAAALARVLAGEEVSAVARALDISRTALQNWLVEGERQPVTLSVMTHHKPSLMDRVGEYLDANLTALHAQASLMAERAWIEKQTTPDLLSAHDVLGRRLVSIVDRIRPSDAADRAADDPAAD